MSTSAQISPRAGSARSPSAGGATAPPGLAYMPALDGVRALAVSAVLAFHGGVTWARGGFLGVDAFFVLSGFLITGLLLAEWQRAGRIDLVAFWGRRARRLLPALLVVIIVVLLGARVLLPAEEVRLLRGDGLAALLYVANWRMILRGGDYFAQTASPSPLEHTWSLGIEEQFYLVWPILVATLLTAVLAGVGRRARLGWVLAVCVLGAVASTALLAAHHGPDGLGRAYYGTDTRGASLLIGAALAVLIARGRPAWTDPGRRGPSRVARIASSAVASAAVLGLAWVWSHADGADPRLYRGGMLLIALAVAVVLAQVTLFPGGWLARVLAVRPLVLLGLISYGVYLWHWPVFIAVNGQRTGLQGTELFALRCLVTLAVAAASFLLVERPVRRGRLIRGLPVTVRAGAGVVGVGAAAGLVVVTTAVPVPVVPAPSDESWVSSSVQPGGRTGRVLEVDRTRPDPRPGHDEPRATEPEDHHPQPGRKPVIHVFGDSVAWSLVKYLPPTPGLHVRGRTLLGCGLARIGPYRYFGVTHGEVGPDCKRWPTLWRGTIAADDPDVALILVGRWETMDRMLQGRWTHVGEPDLDAYLRSELELAIRIAGAHGAQVVLATEPYNQRGERTDGGLHPEDQPERVSAWNALLRRVAADHPEVRVIDFGARVSPGGEFSWTAGGVQVRSDGLHLTQSGVQQWIAPWLLPKLRAVVSDLRR